MPKQTHTHTHSHPISLSSPPPHSPHSPDCKSWSESYRLDAKFVKIMILFIFPTDCSKAICTL